VTIKAYSISPEDSKATITRHLVTCA